jgi:hypothetical protein
MERKNSTFTACDLGDSLVASPAVMCTPLDLLHRKKNLTGPRKPILGRKRSATLTSLTQPLCPLDNGKLTPKAMELLGNFNTNSIDGELTSRKCQEIISASGTPRPRSTGKDCDQLAGDGEVKTPPLSRKERIEAFECERRRCSHKRNGQLIKALKVERAQARPTSADQRASCARTRAARIETFEAERRRSSHERDKELLHLLKIQAAQARPFSADQHATAAKRRAEYDGKRHEEMLKRQERAQQAKAFVRQYLEEWQVPADVGQAVVGKSLLKARLDGCGGIEKEVTQDMVVSSFEEAKSQFFKSKIEPLLAQKCPNGILRDSIQKSSAPWNWVSFLRSNLADDILRNHSSSAAEFIEFVTESDSLVCSICADSMFYPSHETLGVECNFWRAASRKNEHWNNHACGHAFCRSCARRWAETGINEQKVQIRCPAPGCKYCLWDQDLKELLSSNMFRRHEEHLHTDHLDNLKGLAKEDDDLVAWLHQNARPCPDCHVIVSRSEGCNSMICVCGTKFCYACGFKSCKCRTGMKDRADIWQPKA